MVIAESFPYFSPSISRQMSSLIRYCAVCQRVRLADQKRRWNVDIMDKGDSLELSKLPPFTEIQVDVFVIDQQSLKILSAMCRFTRMTRLEPIHDERIETIVGALETLRIKNGGMRVIYTDSARYFSSDTFRQLLKQKLSAELIISTPRSPWSLGAQNVCHRILKSKLTLKLDKSNGIFRSDDERVNKLIKYLANAPDNLATDGRKLLLINEFRKLLDEMELLLNTRPLISASSVYAGVTPYTLAFNLYPSHYFGISTRDTNWDPTKTATVRTEFLDSYWKIMKRATQFSISSKSGKLTNRLFHTGEKVLVYTKELRKLDTGYKIGTFLDSKDNKFLIRYDYPNKTQWEHHYNVVPLSPIPVDSSEETELDSNHNPQLHTESREVAPVLHASP
jgi:hypothetical protein